MGVDFHWGQVISNEISHQLVNYQQTHRFLMLAYPVYAIVYSYVFEEIPPRGVDIREEHVQF